MFYDLYTFYFCYPFARDVVGTISLSYWPTLEQLTQKVRAKAQQWETEGIPKQVVDTWVEEISKQTLPAPPSMGSWSKRIDFTSCSLSISNLGDTTYNHGGNRPTGRDDTLSMSDGRDDTLSMSEPNNPEQLITLCPSCSQKLYVPSLLGELQLTCPKCRHSWLWNPDNEILIKNNQTSELLKEALRYVGTHTPVGRPYTRTTLNSLADDARFIQSMRVKGFINQTQEELINAFKEAKRKFDDHWENYF
ncbi:MAG TPA: hypothetical protein V6C85_23240 [Allocoleopsis sp.]